MNEINQLMNKRLEVICNQFIKEKIGENELNLMPPRDKIPIISRFYYDENENTFEIYFNECNEYVCKTKSGIDFLEDKSGHLMAIRIRNFSKLDVEGIRLNVLTSIENEIELLSVELTKKQNILNNVIDKRKLLFLDELVKHGYEELRKNMLAANNV
jgi:hypothetical protein